jgi:hypothetical protein
MQGEFAAKKYYGRAVKDDYDIYAPSSARVAMELLTLLAAHASKRMDCST